MGAMRLLIETDDGERTPIHTETGNQGNSWFDQQIGLHVEADEMIKVSGTQSHGDKACFPLSLAV